jgi:16S rRNA G966 N2-methylase RsmD
VRRRQLIGAALASPLLLPALGCAQEPVVMIDGGPYVPTPAQVVDEMLKMAEIRAEDTVYDLGSGDGRLVIEAAKRYSARGVGVEREAKLVELSRERALKAGVADRVRFTRDDLFKTDMRRATVVTLYLLPRMMEQLAPKFRAELPAGARIVSHDYPLPGWTLEKSVTLEVEEKGFTHGHTRADIFLYRN